MGRSYFGMLVALGLGVATAAAQELPSEAVVSSITKAGVTEGCSVQYTAVARDHIYKSGSPIGITGSLSWMLHPQMGIGVMIKLITADIDKRAPNSLLTFKVTHGFIRINTKVVQVEQRYDCDQPTGFCGAVGMEKAMDTYLAYANGGESVSFGFNRATAGMDVVVPVPTLSLEQGNQLNECMLQVLQRAQSRMKEKGSR